jgi:SnoaL-like protein
MKTLEQRIQEVEDREEIKELTAKYAHWVARGEGARVKDLFTDDGHFINELPPRLVSGSCSSAREFAPHFLRTSTHGDALALR